MGRTKDHVKRHIKKYTAASLGATLVVGLQVFGALAPLLCNLPWVKDPEACMAQGKRAAEAADKLGQLDSMKLDAPSAGTVDESVDGGDK